MAEKRVLTTVQIDVETDRKLKAIAEAYKRSRPGQVTFWIEQEYAELEKVKLLPEQQAKLAARVEQTLAE